MPLALFDEMATATFGGNVTTFSVQGHRIRLYRQNKHDLNHKSCSALLGHVFKHEHLHHLDLTLAGRPARYMLPNSPESLGKTGKGKQQRVAWLGLFVWSGEEDSAWGGLRQQGATTGTGQCAIPVAAAVVARARCGGYRSTATVLSAPARCYSYGRQRRGPTHP